MDSKNKSKVQNAIKEANNLGLTNTDIFQMFQQQTGQSLNRQQKRQINKKLGLNKKN